MRRVPRYAATVKPDECALITEVFARRLAYPVACLAHRLGVRANTVTLLGGGCWMLSVPMVVLAGWLCGRDESLHAGWLVWLLCGLLWNAGYVLDLADGSLARMTGTASPSGFYLDYVFHLLFKPAFLCSLGVALFLTHRGGLAYLLLAVLAIPANWSASAAAVEHVLCEETGTGRAAAWPQSGPGPAGRRLWLGSTDSRLEARSKRGGLLRPLRVLLQEVLSYYGQFTFFSITVLADWLLASRPLPWPMPVTTGCFVLLTLFLAVRVPFRMARDFRRVRVLDAPGADGGRQAGADV